MSARVAVVAVGRIRDRALRAVADEYLGRLRRYVAVEEVEVKADAGLTAALPADARVVALEVEGEALSSPAFASRMQRWLGTGKGRVAFVIGGAEGLPSAITRRADHALSLSSMTLPHRLARVLLLEQLYRAMSILRGEPYAREE